MHQPVSLQRSSCSEAVVEEVEEVEEVVRGSQRWGRAAG